MPSKNLAWFPAGSVIRTVPLRASISEPLLIAPSTSGTNLPLTLISTVPLTGGDAVGGTGVAVGVAVGAGVGAGGTGVGVGIGGTWAIGWPSIS